MVHEHLQTWDAIKHLTTEISAIPPTPSPEIGINQIIYNYFLNTSYSYSIQNIRDHIFCDIPFLQ